MPGQFIYTYLKKYQTIAPLGLGCIKVSSGSSDDEAAPCDAMRCSGAEQLDERPSQTDSAPKCPPVLLKFPPAFSSASVFTFSPAFCFAVAEAGTLMSDSSPFAPVEAPRRQF